jgi:hypothetical protein
MDHKGAQSDALAAERRHQASIRSQPTPQNRSTSDPGMTTDKHYFIEENDAGKFAVRARGSQRASGLRDTQKQAEELAKKLNPDDKPNVERVRNTKGGRLDQWIRVKRDALRYTTMGEAINGGESLLRHSPIRDSRLQPGITRFQSQEAKTQKPLAKVA